MDTCKQRLKVKFSLLYEWESAFHYLVKEGGKPVVEGLDHFMLFDLHPHRLGVSVHINGLKEAVVDGHFLGCPRAKALDLLTPAIQSHQFSQRCLPFSCHRQSRPQNECHGFLDLHQSCQSGSQQLPH